MNHQGLMPDKLGDYRLLDRIGEGGMGLCPAAPSTTW